MTYDECHDRIGHVIASGVVLKAEAKFGDVNLPFLRTACL